MSNKGTTLIKGSPLVKVLDELPTQQRDFLLNYIASPTANPGEAAKAAGYAKPSLAANRLMKMPKIQRVLRKLRRQREERTLLKADDILEFLYSALMFNPTKWFFPSDEGRSWVIRDLNELPEEYGRLIEGFEIKQIKTPDGETITYYKVKLISKAIVLQLAMKHQGLLETKINVSGSIKLNWADMVPDHTERVPDRIEQRILDVEAKVVEDKEPTNGQPRRA